MQKSLFPRRWCIFSGSVLKLIAVIAMLVDHTALVLRDVFPALTVPLLTVFGKELTLYFLLRRIGRLAFPIYCFLIAEGFAHTRNRLRYLAQLLLFALLSEIPFNLILSGTLLYPGGQNVFFTLFFGGLMIFLYEYAQEDFRKAVWMLLVLMVAAVANADYGLKGVALILLIYVFRSKPTLQVVLSYPLLSGGIAAFAAFLPIHLYNGQRGFIRSKVLKYAFYVFYPAHMLILTLIRSLLTL